MNNVSFCHRPDAGVSVGFMATEGGFMVATAIVNDGFSRSGKNQNPDRRDFFARKVARHIINGRLEHGVNVAFYETDRELFEIVREFRREFNPSTASRAKVTADQIEQGIQGLCNQLSRVKNEVEA